MLYVADGDGEARAALDHAARLAASHDARLTVVDVVPEPPRLTTTLPVSERELMAAQVKQRLVELEALVSSLKTQGLRPGLRVLTGNPFIEIVRKVLRDGYDLVVKTARGGGSGDALFGSTDTHLLRKCPCAVWINRPTRRRQYARVLAAVDPQAQEGAASALNGRVLELAISMARLEQAELHVAHICEFDAESALQGPFFELPPARVGALAREERKGRRAALEELVAAQAVEGIELEVDLLKARPAAGILGLVEKKRVDLVVMGTVQHLGAPGLFIGSTAEEVLSRIDCSVMTLKPEGFVSPVPAQ